MFRFVHKRSAKLINKSPSFTLIFNIVNYDPLQNVIFFYLCPPLFYQMREKSIYLIDFGGLNTGVHEIEFHVDKTFFAKFENTLVQQGDIDILVTIDRKPNLALVDFTFNGTISTICDRCLDSLDIEIEGYNELLVKFGSVRKEESESDDMDVITLAEREQELDLSEFIYEYVTLQIPIRNVHPEDENGNSTCNSEALKEMEKHITHEHTDDPRWEVLKKINLN